MNKLRLLRLAGVKLNGDFKYLSRDLKWLYWHGFAETCIPTEFLQGSLVAVELKYSKLKQLWNKSQVQKLSRFSGKYPFFQIPILASLTIKLLCFYFLADARESKNS